MTTQEAAQNTNAPPKRRTKTQHRVSVRAASSSICSWSNVLKLGLLFFLQVGHFNPVLLASFLFCRNFKPATVGGCRQSHHRGEKDSSGRGQEGNVCPRVQAAQWSGVTVWKENIPPPVYQPQEPKWIATGGHTASRQNDGPSDWNCLTMFTKYRLFQKVEDFSQNNFGCR